MTEEGATAAPPETAAAPSWLQALLDHQNEQTRHLQMMLAPVLSHITREQQTPPSLNTAAGGGDMISQLTRERHPPPQPPSVESSVASSAPVEVSVRPRATSPFAAELGVINQRSQNSGPTRRTANSDPDSRRRENRSSDRESDHSLAYHDNRRMNNTGTYNMLPEIQRPKLATFDGSEDWDSFLMPFERQARKYGWSTMERVDRLHECLRGAAVRYVISLPERTREDYVLLVEQLTQRFGKKDPPTTIRRKLGELRQGRESSAEFAEEVQRLVTLAYPGVDLQLQDQLATDAFLKGLRNQKVAYEVMNRDPTSLAEAEKFAEAHEHNFKATVGRETEIKNRARRISWADEDNCGNTPSMSRRVQTSHYVTMDQFSAVMDQVKTLVHSVGNLQLQMERFQSTNVANQQTKSSHVIHNQDDQQVHTSRGRSQTVSPNRGASGQCYKCGETGHFKKDCTRSLSPGSVHNNGNNSADLQLTRTPSPDPQLLGRQITCTEEEGESLQVPLTINGISTQAIVDTGAQTTVISEEFYQSIPKSDTAPKDLHQTYLLNAGLGGGMKAKRGLSVAFHIGSKIINWEVHVAPIRDSVLLGLDLMKANDAVIYACGKIFFGDELIPSKMVTEDRGNNRLKTYNSELSPVSVTRQGDRVLQQRRDIVNQPIKEDIPLVPPWSLPDNDLVSSKDYTTEDRPCPDAA